MQKSDFDEYFAVREKGAFREAYDVLRGILKNHRRWSNVGDLYVWCAELELMLNSDVKKASELLEKARRLGCRYMDAYYRQHGLLLLRKGEYEEGVEELERAVELNPGVFSLTALGTALTEENDPRAIAIWQRILAEDPGNCRAHIGMGRLAAGSGDRGRALLLVKRAERLNPSVYDVSEIARLYFELGEYRRAIDAYLKTERQGKEPKGPLYAAIAACYFSIGEDDSGEKYLQWAVRHDPEHEYVREVCDKHQKH